MAERPVQHEFASFDGARIAYWTLGDGPPVLMLHGFLANSQFNWIEPGIAGAVADAGFRAIMMDLRGHGSSAAPDEKSAYPHDVLALDAEALIVHLGLVDFQLVGYSLGARTAVRMLARGVTPRRCVLGGMGDRGVIGTSVRVEYFEDLILKGANSVNPEAAKTVTGMMKRGGLKPQPMLNVLYAQVSTQGDALHEINVPTLVVSGDRDNDNGSAENLAAMLGNAKALRVPGTHLSAVGKRELTEAIVGFLQR